MAVNMTEGSASKHLLRFAIPMVLGNMFQLTYNAVDSIIVNRYAGKVALSAISVANPIMNIVIFMISGMCLGTSVLMSEFFGAKDEKRLKSEIATVLTAGSMFTAFLIVSGMLLTEPILRIMKTPEETLPDAMAYLRIIFLGLAFSFLYNVFAAILRSMGDSKTPVYFIMISAVFNGVLDYILVAGFQLGVYGAGIATLCSQAVSGVLCMWFAKKRYEVVRLKFSEYHINKTLLGKTVSYSFATGLQQIFLYVGKLLVQGAVNPLGVDYIAVYNAVCRVDDFVFTPQQSIAQGVTTFMAQNRGAGKKSRMLDGCRKGIVMTVIYAIFIGVVIYINADRLVAFFLPDGGDIIVNQGRGYMHLMAFFYVLPALTNSIQGFFRGIGNMKITFQSTGILTIFRVLATYLVTIRLGVPGLGLACAIGWIAMLIFEGPQFIVAYRKLKKEAEVQAAN